MEDKKFGNLKWAAVAALRRAGAAVVELGKDLAEDDLAMPEVRDAYNLLLAAFHRLQKI